MEEKFTFMTEKTKERPLNKRKLARRALTTGFLAILFGMTAAVAYTVGVRHMEDVIYPKSPEIVTIDQQEESLSGNETASENEISPEETEIRFTESENEIDESVLEESKQDAKETSPSVSGNGANSSDEPNVIVNTIIKKADMNISDYENLYSSMYNMARKASSSMVHVTGVRSDMNWFSENYENSAQGFGLLIADNRKELLILVDRSIIMNADLIRVRFPSGVTAEAKEKKYDANLDLSIIAVELQDLDSEALKNTEMAQLGISVGSSLLGHGIIAIGNPVGVDNSVVYGTVTSSSGVVQLKDSDVHLLTTDIYGSRQSTGVLINFSGQVVGIITHDHTDNNLQNMISAYGISDIKKSIERMSNGQDAALLGIYGVDVTAEANEQHGIPMGAYVKEIAMDSPAMECGIQGGDIITMVGTTQISSFTDYKQAILQCKPEDEIKIMVKRFAMGEYTDMTFEVTLGTLE